MESDNWLAVKWTAIFESPSSISSEMLSSLPFLDLPQEWLLTTRCDRYLSIANPTGLNKYRQRFARLLCQNLLDPFQSGGHCRGINP